MVSQSRFHGRSNPQGFVNPAEVVVHEVQGDSVAVIFDLFGKTVGQAGEASHAHSHAEVLTFHKTGRDVLRIRFSAEYASAAPNTGCRAVAAFWRVARCAEHSLFSSYLAGKKFKA